MTVSVDIQHRFGDFALDVQFEAPQGLTVLFGRSGSGKTTVINAVAGLLKPDSGHIAIDGRVLLGEGVNLPAHKRRVGYVFQDARLFPHLTVQQNLNYGRWFAPKAARPQNTDRIVEMLGLEQLLTRRPAQLSGGEKQRVAIGRALMSSPDVLLADEPLAALDEQRKEAILPYFEKLRDEAGVPILYVSHSPSEVARLATTVVALQNGKVLRAGEAHDVLSDPAVTPVGAMAAGAMLTTTVGTQHDDGLTELRFGAESLLVPHVDKPTGAGVRVHVEAQDVMLSLERPTGISALNVIPAKVRSIRMGDGPGALVQLETGGERLLARVTRRSVAALGLTEGLELYAVLKAVSVSRSNLGS